MQTSCADYRTTTFIETGADSQRKRVFTLFDMHIQIRKFSLADILCADVAWDLKKTNAIVSDMCGTGRRAGWILVSVKRIITNDRSSLPDRRRSSSSMNRAIWRQMKDSEDTDVYLDWNFGTSIIYAPNLLGLWINVRVSTINNRDDERSNSTEYCLWY